MTKRLPCLLIALLAVGIAWPASAQFPSDRTVRKVPPHYAPGATVFAVPVSVRGAGLGDATASVPLGAGSVFTNPAFIGRTEQTAAVTMSRTSDVAEVKHTAGAGAFRPFAGQFGAIAAGARRITLPPVAQLVRADNQRGYVKVGTHTPTARELVLSYGVEVDDQVAIGLSGKQLRFGRQAVTRVSEAGHELVPIYRTAAALDGGVGIGPVLEGLRFGALMRNYPLGSDRHFEGARTTQVGVSADLFGLSNRLGLSVPANQELLLALDRRWGDRGGVHVGGEYGFEERLFVRAGWRSAGRRTGSSLGAGGSIELYGLVLQADYAYTDVELDGMHRLSLSIGL